LRANDSASFSVSDSPSTTNPTNPRAFRGGPPTLYAPEGREWLRRDRKRHFVTGWLSPSHCRSARAGCNGQYRERVKAAQASVDGCFGGVYHLGRTTEPGSDAPTAEIGSVEDLRTWERRPFGW
jgi:hypothetical protein